MHDRFVSPNGNPSAPKGLTGLRIFYILAATFALLAMVACSGGWGERPEIVQGPVSQTVISGQTATFSVAVAGTAPLKYQWFEGGVAISGATGSSYTTPVTAGSDNGSVFSVTVTNAAGGVASASAILTVNVPPAIVTPPLNQTVISGQTATFSVTATGTAPLVYQWFRGSSVISGATSSSYTTPVTAGSDNGAVFSVVVSNMAGTVTSSPATLTVNVPPAITLQPVSDRVDAGATATFSVAATGTAPLSYQWYRSGAPISGATASSYTTAATAGSDNGAVFTVVVTNVAGTVTSAAATLRVNVGPTITTQPLSQTITAGQTATLSVVATGTYPMTYQWSLNGAPIGGATANFYTTPALSGTNNGALYTVAVTNVAGTTTSVPAVLTVNVPPTISMQPLSQTVIAPATAAFSVVAAGTAPLSYQWYLNGASIPGAVSSSYVTGATTGNNSGAMYTVTITNVAGFVTSAAATLTVNVTPSITTQPVSQTVNAGQTATFFVAATGTSPLNYQWYKSGMLIPGAISRYYTTPATVSGDNGAIYSVVVSNVAGPVTSTEATLTVNSAPTITLQPVSQTVTAPATATFSVTATGTAPLSYQWYMNGAEIGGATSSSYTTAATTSSNDGALFTVVVTNSAGPVTSAAATLTVNVVPTILAQPVNQTVTEPATATFNVAASGSGTLTYQWYVNDAPIGGATSSSYTTPATTATNNGAVYTVKVTNSVGTVTSMAATLTVYTTPLATSLTCSSATPLAGASISVTSNFSGGTATIGSAGFGSSDVTASAVSGMPYTTGMVTAPTTFTLTVTGTGGAAAVNTCTATPLPVTITPITPAAQTMAPGAQAFTATATGGTTNNLTWTATGGSFSGDVWTAPNTPGTYTITATSVDEPSVHVTTTVTVSDPVITLQPASKNACIGYNPSLTVAANYAMAYQWYFNGNPIGTGLPTLALTDASSSNNGNYTCAVSNAAGSVTSNVATLNVVSPTTLTITTQPASVSVYATQTATFSVSATGTGTLAYQWYTGTVGSGTAINGATSSTYTTPALTAANSGTSYYVTVTDTDCTDTTLTSTAATLTVSAADTAVPPTIVVQPIGQTAAVGGTATFSVTASGSGTLTYQWYRVPFSSTELSSPTAGVAITDAATTSIYTVPSSETAQINDGDNYYVVVTNDYGSAQSNRVVLATGTGILLQITGNPQPAYVAPNTLANFGVTATCTGCIPAYQWYWYAPGSTTGVALTDGAVSSGALSGATIAGSATSSLTLQNTPATATGAIFYAVVTSTSDGTTLDPGTNPLTSSTAGLFVGSLGTVGDTSIDGGGLCNSSTANWVLNGNSPGTSSGDVPYQNTSACTMELTNDQGSEHAAVYWPTLISTANFSVSFTVTITHDTSLGASADGFTMVLADPSQGATTASLGAVGEGLGADGIPGFVLGFDTYQNGNLQTNRRCTYSGSIPCDPVAVPYMAVGQGTSSLWENPWTFVNGDLNTQNSMDYTDTAFTTNASHNYVVSVVNKIMTVTMDGYELFTGTVSLPPSAYLGFTASTGASMEAVTFSNLTATVSAP